MVFLINLKDAMLTMKRPDSADVLKQANDF
jgi:hypothetical protein